MSVLYFAYGSNLDPEQMRRRCPSTEAVGPARLPEHRLFFAGASRNWNGGGTATLEPDPTVHVPGFLYRISGDDLADLDRYEGSYRRERLAVHVPRGDESLAWVYIRKNDTPIRAPSRRYLAVMAHAYGRLGYDLDELMRHLPAEVPARRASPRPNLPSA